MLVDGIKIKCENMRIICAKHFFFNVQYSLILECLKNYSVNILVDDIDSRCQRQVVGYSLLSVGRCLEGFKSFAANATASALCFILFSKSCSKFAEF